MDQALTVAEQRSLTEGGLSTPLVRALRVKEELRRQARVARLRQGATRHAPGRNLWLPDLTTTKTFEIPLFASFLIFVALPALAITIYFALIATSQYVAEARFAVRAADTTGLDALADVTGLPALSEAQDAMIITNYLNSPAIVDALERRVGLRKIYGNPSIDRISRLPADAPVEKLERYWRGRISESIEAASGIITVRVWAFSPEDAYTVGNAVVSLSEELVNRLGDKARTDAVAQAESAMRSAEDRLRTARSAVRSLRNKDGLIDPKQSVDGINKLIADLRTNLVLIDQELATTRRTLDAGAPQLSVLEAKRDATNEQIARLQSQLTDVNGKDPATIASVMTRYDQMDLERQIAEAQYTTAATGLEQARLNAERQRMYLATFVRPVVAEESGYPYRFWQPVAGFFILILLWLTGRSMFRSLKKH